MRAHSNRFGSQIEIGNGVAERVRRCRAILSAPLARIETAAISELTLLSPARPTSSQRLISLVETEQRTEEEQSSLLLSSCSFSLLVQRGLALGSLSPSHTSIGLSGRTLLDLDLSSAVAGSRPAGAKLPPHGFRTGDLAVMIPAGGVAGPGGGADKGAAKAKGGKARSGGTKGKAGEEAGGVDWQRGVKGVVYRVTENRITLALGGGSPVGGGGAEDDDKDQVELGTNLKLQVAAACRRPSGWRPHPAG